MKHITITDVARRAKVSKTTVSHYLNERFTNMSSKTKARISSAIDELNYSPNYVAKSLKNKKTMTIGIIVANILHNFSTRIIRSIEDYANSRDYHVIVCNADNDPLKEEDYISMLLAKQVDGLIVIPTPGNNDEFKALADAGYPLVFVDRYIEGVCVPSFLLDNARTIQIAFDHLFKKGFKHIGYISQQVNDAVTRLERRDAYIEECLRHDVKALLIDGDLSSITEKIREHIKNDSMPEALIVGNDLTLFEVLKAVKQYNINIPEELSIISVDNIEFTEFFNPSLTVIAQPAYDIGTAATKHLFDVLNGINPKPQVHRFEPELIERESVINHEHK
ncbi:LacI family DNA-binding transcriptional regulator [Salinicoccus albus]|uniref:LacI family DNA-binding transcriptional regulator n=1 Tax=Salinicoccus albus TaxID=418756 RepID=UPI000361F40D|nr:LacI family DNA-binding transcriptional regulator [Salinicoccus albus]